MAIDVTALQNALHSLFAPILGVTTIWANQNAPRPPRPYATLQLTAVRHYGPDEERRTATEGVYEMVGPRDLTVRVQWIGPNSLLNLDRLRNELMKPTVKEAAQRLHLSVFDWSTVTDISALQDAREIEERSTMDVFVRAANNYGAITPPVQTVDNVSVIETVEITAETRDEAGDVITPPQTLTVTISGP